MNTKLQTHGTWQTFKIVLVIKSGDNEFDEACKTHAGVEKNRTKDQSQNQLECIKSVNFREMYFEKYGMD